MIKDGAMQDVEGILGVHVFPTIPGGCVGIRHGALTAAADDLELIVIGESWRWCASPRGDRRNLDCFSDNYHLAAGN